MNKNKIAVMADSGTDVPPNYREKYGIYWLPLLINYSDRTYLAGIDIQPHEMYDRLPVEIPKTSLPDRGMVTDLFDRIKADGYEKLLVVTISSGLSGTYNMVRLAAEDYSGLEISVLDTRNISIGSGLIAIRAAQMDRSCFGNARNVAQFKADNILQRRGYLLHRGKGNRQGAFNSEGAGSGKGIRVAVVPQ